jgi:hypothetical protein
MQFDGDERRQSAHCDLHENNTEKITNLSSAYSTLKWVTGIGLPVIVVMVAGFYSMSQDFLKMLSNDMKEVKAMLVTTQVDRAVFSNRLTSVELDVKEIRERLEKRGNK